MPTFISPTPTGSTYSSGVTALSGIIPIVFVAMLIFGVLRSMGGFGDGGETKATKTKRNIVRIIKNSKEFVLRIENSSQKYAKFLSNIDELFGIKTINDDHSGDLYGLSLTENKKITGVLIKADTETNEPALIK